MEVAGGDTFETGALFEVADRELDNGGTTMEQINLNCWTIDVGHEAVVSPAGPQLQLRRVDQPGATHDHRRVTALLALPVVYSHSATCARPSGV